MIENLAEVASLLDAGEAVTVEDYLSEAKRTRERLKRIC